MSKLITSKIILLKNKGFTILELLVAIAIAAILTSIALPSLNDFTLQMRVDNEISEIHRLILTARNSAVNEALNVTVCPLVTNTCSSNWQGELSVFIDGNGNAKFESLLNERILKVKGAIKNGDKLQFSQNSLTYAPTGFLINTGGPYTFNYCPYSNANRSRGIIISSSGRLYDTTDNNNDGKEEDRNGNNITCS